jgi:hypothetical protein
MDLVNQEFRIIIRTFSNLLTQGPPPPLPFGGFAAPSLPVSRPIVRKGFKPSQEMKNLYWNRIQMQENLTFFIFFA